MSRLVSSRSIHEDLSMSRQYRGACGVLAMLAVVQSADSKPIAYAKGTTVMAEYGAGTMNEVQVFYAPRYFYSAGAGHLALQSDVDGRTRDISYTRINYLAKRWNGEAAQGNIFVWGGAGNAHVGGAENVFAWNAGAQADYETRRVYASFKTDLHESSAFSHRIDTLQLGIAPYEHDYESLATWFVVQGRRYTGEIHDGTEWALLVRLFKHNTWVEAGATTDGHVQAMLMFNF
jgi:hypothetical protein